MPCCGSDLVRGRRSRCALQCGWCPPQRSSAAHSPPRRARHRGSAKDILDFPRRLARRGRETFFRCITTAPIWSGARMAGHSFDNCGFDSQRRPDGPRGCCSASASASRRFNPRADLAEALATPGVARATEHAQPGCGVVGRADRHRRRRPPSWRGARDFFHEEHNREVGTTAERDRPPDFVVQTRASAVSCQTSRFTRQARNDDRDEPRRRRSSRARAGLSARQTDLFVSAGRGRSSRSLRFRSSR